MLDFIYFSASFWPCFSAAAAAVTRLRMSCGVAVALLRRSLRRRRRRHYHGDTAHQYHAQATRPNRGGATSRYEDDAYSTGRQGVPARATSPWLRPATERACVVARPEPASRNGALPLLGCSASVRPAAASFVSCLWMFFSYRYLISSRKKEGVQSDPPGDSRGASRVYSDLPPSNNFQATSSLIIITPPLHRRLSIFSQSSCGSRLCCR